jgi:hypothetical protein
MQFIDLLLECVVARKAGFKVITNLVSHYQWSNLFIGIKKLMKLTPGIFKNSSVARWLTFLAIHLASSHSSLSANGAHGDSPFALWSSKISSKTVFCYDFLAYSFLLTHRLFSF